MLPRRIPSNFEATHSQFNLLLDSFRRSPTFRIIQAAEFASRGSRFQVSPAGLSLSLLTPLLFTLMDRHRQTELSDEEKARRRASERNEIIESFNSEIDSVVRNASHRLSQHERNLIKQWAVNMKGQLGTDGNHSFVQVLRDVKVEKGILLAIRKFGDEVRYMITPDVNSYQINKLSGVN